VLLGPDRYEPCHVVAVHHTGMSNDMVYDVQLDNGSNKVINNVPTKGLRRNYKNDDDDEFSTLPALTRVMALYRDDDGNAVDYFPGRIIQYNTNRKSYDVEFDDGDVAYNIRRNDIELMVQSSDK
jgi:Histone methyltransferase Tudor domain 1